MTVSRIDLDKYLAQLFTPEQFEDYAPNGLQIEGDTSIDKIAFAVSATQESITAATDWGAQALVVHHGLFWKHQGVKTITGPWGKRLKLCIQNNLNLFAYHLPLDAHPEIGNATALAMKLGMVNLGSFANYKKSPLGIKGNLPSPLPAKILKELLQTTLDHNVILASPDENQLVNSIGIITGGANNEWIQAKNEGLDAFITGEISEYNWHDAKEAGVHYFAGGHHATEKYGTMALMEKIERQFPNLRTRFFDSENLA